MNGRLIPYGRQSVSDEDIQAVAEVLRGDYLTQGPCVDAFEAALAARVSASSAVAVANGTAGLHIAFLAAGIGPGDAVIVPAITFAATSNAVLYCGGTPIFADVDPSTGSISVASAERCIELARATGLRPKAIAPVHYAGLPAPMRDLVYLARRHNLFVIEDACHALGAQYDSGEGLRPVGAAVDTDMTVFSFHPVKHIATGEGGAVTTRSDALAKRLRMLRTHGITKQADEFEISARAFDPASGEVNPWYMEMQHLGLNYRLSDILAALGASQLRRLDDFVARRRQVADRYHLELKDIRHLALPAGDRPDARHSYHLFPVQIDFAALGKSRAKVIGELRRRGVGAQVHYLPVYFHPYYARHSHQWLRDDTPGAEAYYARQLSIPMFASLSAVDVDTVVAGLRASLES